jgi:hypothetical protein
MLSSWIKWGHRESVRPYPQVETYQTVSTASVDALWQRIINLADVSWHPMIVSTNVPKGLIPKPGLIYQAVSRFLPFRINIFVERVQPRELLSVRIIALPGVEERVTYRVESTLCGTRVSYSVTLRGWLSPLVWSLIRPYAARVAAELAQAAEQDPDPSACQRRPQSQFSDLLGWVILVAGTGCSVSTLNFS